MSEFEENIIVKPKSGNTGLISQDIVVEEVQQEQQEQIVQNTETIEEVNENTYFDKQNEFSINLSYDEIYDFTINELYRTLNKNQDIIFPRKKQKLTEPIIEYDFKARKTFWKNFKNICAEMNREDKQVKDFIENDLKKQSSIGLNGELRITGRYEILLSKTFDRYIKKYLICSSCGSIKTDFKQNYKLGLDYIVCTTCHCEKSV
jgi:translation initiation factor 2 beta subunit (eIF-2beta)/eIF-5